MGKIISIVVSLLVTLVVVYLTWANQGGSATLTGLGSGISTNSGTVLFAGFIAGCMAALGLLILAIGKAKQESKHLQQWQAQDAKLIASVQNDREKQLEAKIATLEAALQQALKR